jgi:hypothetical protein
VVLKAREAIGTLAADHTAVLVLLGREDLAEIVAEEKVDLAGRSWVRESTCELRWTYRETGRGAGMMTRRRLKGGIEYVQPPEGIIKRREIGKKCPGAGGD